MFLDVVSLHWGVAARFKLNTRCTEEFQQNLIEIVCTVFPFNPSRTCFLLNGSRWVSLTGSRKILGREVDFCFNRMRDRFVLPSCTWCQLPLSTTHSESGLECLFLQIGFCFHTFTEWRLDELGPEPHGTNCNYEQKCFALDFRCHNLGRGHMRPEANAINTIYLSTTALEEPKSEEASRGGGILYIGSRFEFSTTSMGPQTRKKRQAWKRLECNFASDERFAIHHRSSCRTKDLVHLVVIHSKFTVDFNKHGVTTFSDAFKPLRNRIANLANSWTNFKSVKSTADSKCLVFACCVRTQDFVWGDLHSEADQCKLWDL